jgi:hypothetical protein
MPFITQGKTDIKYILIVVILAVIAGGGILGYQYWWMPRKEIESSSCPAPPICEGELLYGDSFSGCPSYSCVDETVNWKIYRNEEYGFEIKYPLENWDECELDKFRLEKGTLFHITEKNTECFPGPSLLPGQVPGDTIGIYVNSDIINVYPNYSELKKALEVSLGGTFKINGNDLFDAFKIEEITLGGQKALKVAQGSGIGMASTGIYIFHNQSLFDIYIHTIQGKDYSKMEKILSTFRFLD